MNLNRRQFGLTLASSTLLAASGFHIPAQPKNTRKMTIDLVGGAIGVSGNQREMIDIKSFLSALQTLGYDGPVRAEPFNQTLRELDNDDACAATAQALRKAFAL